jgi:hypothetical protein
MNKLPKQIKFSVVKKRATRAFQLYVRLRDTDYTGHGKCCTCRKQVYYKFADAGHWITRKEDATLFDECNCHLQCKGCNGLRNLHHIYRTFLVDTYGEDAVKKLEFKARQICKRTVADLLYLERFYKQQSQLLLEEKVI